MISHVSLYFLFDLYQYCLTTSTTGPDLKGKLTVMMASQDDEITPVVRRQPTSVQRPPNTLRRRPTIQNLSSICRYSECQGWATYGTCLSFCSEHCCATRRDHRRRRVCSISRNVRPAVPRDRREECNDYCNHIGCDEPKLQVCPRYCRSHCCIRVHQKWKIHSEKEQRRKSSNRSCASKSQIPNSDTAPMITKNF